MVGALTQRHELASLKSSGVAVMPSEHVIGFAVHDIDNVRIGEVDDLIVDLDVGRVRFLVVGQGGIMGFGRTRRLLPVDIINEVVGDSTAPTIYVNAPAALMADAPRGDDLEEGNLLITCRYYGCEPFWSEGYVARDWTATKS